MPDRIVTPPARDLKTAGDKNCCDACWRGFHFNELANFYVLSARKWGCGCPCHAHSTKVSRLRDALIEIYNAPSLKVSDEVAQRILKETE